MHDTERIVMDSRHFRKRDQALGLSAIRKIRGIGMTVFGRPRDKPPEDSGWTFAVKWGRRGR